VELDAEGKVARVIAATTWAGGQPVSVEGQIEGGVVMSLGYSLTEDFPLENGRPKAVYATLGLFRANQTPPVQAVIVEKNHDPLACGAKGIGEICSIPPPGGTACLLPLRRELPHRPPPGGHPLPQKKA
jgi:CO/xanthine dehydrogenase Mo-binding subunit